MKREIAATIFTMLLAGTALAGPIEQSELPPPSQKETPDSAQLRGLIENTLNERHQTAQAPSLAHEDWNIYSSAELWLDGIPESEGISLDALAQKQKRYPGYNTVEEKSNSIPTAYNWQRGNLKANVGTNVTAASATPTVIPTDIYAGTLANSGGTGAIDGRLEYDLNTWQLYGGTKRSLVANPDGTVSVNNNFTGGTYYNLPPSLLGGKVGTGFEVNPTGDAKTRLEYRQIIGNTEGFLAAERTTPFQHLGPDVTGVNGLKAGINRKF
ncbi:MAG: hypothetical protein K2P86_09060 [Xanthobacteraceae bacterium]|nr:hypothetical protein [Xanthobacteraceae bacterium]